MARITHLALLGLIGAALGSLSRNGSGLRRLVQRMLDAGPALRHPIQISSRNWSSIARRTTVGLIEYRVASVGASVAFFAIMSLAPALSVMIAIYGLFVAPAAIPAQIAVLTAVLPDAARILVEEQALRLTSRPIGDLSLTLLVSLAIAVWSANAAVKALFEELNIIHGRPETRSIVRFNLVSLAFTFAAVLAAVAIIFAMAVIPGLLAFLPLSGSMETLLGFIRWPLVYVAGFVAMLILFAIGPDRPAPAYVWLLPGAIIASGLWALVSVGFSFYVTRIVSYSATHGSLATVVITMTWMRLSAMNLLAGAVLNAEIETEYRRSGAQHGDGDSPA